MKVEFSKPNIVVVDYKQDKNDEDYGSCLWARFYIDTDNYTLMIESDCGNYTYGWTPTPDSEPFLKLVSRVNEDYLLGKISSCNVVNGEKTFANVKEYLEEILDSEEPDFDYADIENVCYYTGTDEVYNAILDSVRYTNAHNESFDDYCIWECIETDYPASAKKICNVFCRHIQPFIRESINRNNEDKPANKQRKGSENEPTS